MSQAVRHFEAFLEAFPRPSNDDFDAWLADHPEHAEELVELWLGLLSVRAFGEAESFADSETIRGVHPNGDGQANGDAPPNGTVSPFPRAATRWFIPLTALAAGLTMSTWFGVQWLIEPETPAPNSTASTTESSAASQDLDALLATTALRWMVAMVEGGESLSQADGRALRQAFREGSGACDRSGDPVLALAFDGMASKLNSCGVPLEGEGAEGEFLGLQRTWAWCALSVGAQGGQFAAASFLGRLFAASRRPESVPFRVIDLDADVVDPDGLEVFAIATDLTNGEAEEPVFLGHTPCPEFILPPGDYRIIVQDPRTRRHARVRHLVYPSLGEPTLPCVVFLRKLDAREAGLARFESAEFLFGDDEVPTHLAEHSRTVEEFWISPYEETNESYVEFLCELAKNGHRWLPTGRSVAPPYEPIVELDDGATVPEKYRRHAVRGVTWNDAVLYASWRGMRLVTDAEWEWVATGPEGRAYPWGPKFDATRVGPHDTVDWVPNAGGFDVIPKEVLTSPVDEFVSGGTPAASNGLSVLRMSDNVREWTEDLAAFQVDRKQLVIFQFGEDRLKRAVRGGGWNSLDEEGTTVKERAGFLAGVQDLAVGIRCAKGPYPELQAR